MLNHNFAMISKFCFMGISFFGISKPNRGTSEVTELLNHSFCPNIMYHYHRLNNNKLFIIIKSMIITQIFTQIFSMVPEQFVSYLSCVQEGANPRMVFLRLDIFQFRVSLNLP